MSGILRSVAVVAVLALLQLGCASALGGGLAVRGLAVGARLGAMEAVAGRAAAGLAVEEMALAGRLGVGASAGRLAGTLALTEARVAAVAGRSGLAGVLNELAATRTTAVISRTGRVVVGGETVLATNGVQIALPSSGRVVGRIEGSRIFAVDQWGQRGREIGALSINQTRIVGDLPIGVVRVAPNWYRIVPRSANSMNGVLLIPLASEQDEREKEVRKKAADALAAIRAFRSGR